MLAEPVSNGYVPVELVALLAGDFDVPFGALAPGVPAVELCGRERRGPDAVERVEDGVAGVGERPEQPADQLRREHRRVVLAPAVVLQPEHVGPERGELLPVDHAGAPAVGPAGLALAVGVVERVDRPVFELPFGREQLRGLPRVERPVVERPGLVREDEDGVVGRHDVARRRPRERVPAEPVYGPERPREDVICTAVVFRLREIPRKREILVSALGDIRAD
jgi:hypothetical protein